MKSITPPPKPAFRVLTLNLHKGVSPLRPRNNMLTRLRHAIRSCHADFVFLQEVIGESDLREHRVDGWEGEAQFEYLADQVWHHHAYGKNAVFSRRHHGNAILSRIPIIEYNNIDISTNRVERRGLLHAVTEDPETKQRFELLCVHIDLIEKGRRQQLEKIVKRIASGVQSELPLILCGDFNDWRQYASDYLHQHLGLQEAFLEQSGKHARTFPSFAPILRLDRVYTRNLQLQKARVLKGKPWNRLSDHLPLIADYRLAP